MSCRSPYNAAHRAAEELIAFEPVSDVLLLAAIERAAVHARRESASMTNIVEHLGYSRSPRATAHLKRQLAALAEDGMVEQQRSRGIVSWRLTSRGCLWLRRARRASEAASLPESPQHRLWRHSRSIAADQIDDLRNQTRILRDEFARLLSATPRAASQRWFDLASKLCTACRALGEATYSLTEWDEPDDAQPADHYFYVGDALDQLRGTSPAPPQVPRTRRQPPSTT
ncbi:MAG: hypothetical protein ACYCU0_06900 [Solirubrobacteraceae bacterium]